MAGEEALPRETRTRGPKDKKEAAMGKKIFDVSNPEVPSVASDEGLPLFLCAK